MSSSVPSRQELDTDEGPQHAAPERPEPVLDAAKLAGAVAAVLIAVAGILQVLGVVLPFDIQALADRVSAMLLAAAGLWAVGGPWLTARTAREKVTPLESPRLPQVGLDLSLTGTVSREQLRRRD